MTPKMGLSPIIFFIATFALSTWLFFPALFNFYSHDDFFHYKIAKADSVKEFIGFFDLTKGPEGWGYYRPLTTQVLYLVGREVFHFNPIAMHALAFLMFFGVVFLVFRVLEQLTRDRMVAYFGTAFYAWSASHYSHLYSLANQELGHALFYLSAVLGWMSFLRTSRFGKAYGLSLLAFLGALVSKEFAMTLPAALVLVYGLFRLGKETKVSIGRLLTALLPFGAIWTTYVYLHYFQYGLVQGESYIWVFTPQVLVNSLMWYGLWALSLPKLLSNFEFFGPGFSPNLTILQAFPHLPWVFGLFGGLLVSGSVMALFGLKKMNRRDGLLFLFSLLWFSAILTPVLFLPWHKFTTYLTLPLVGVAASVGVILARFREQLLARKQGSVAHVSLAILAAMYLGLSSLTLRITVQTDWITVGARTARRVHDYLQQEYAQVETPITLAFYDQPEDQQLLLKPSDEVRLALSGNNFFAVFYEGKIRAIYAHSEEEIQDPEAIRIPARQFVEF